MVNVCMYLSDRWPLHCRIGTNAIAITLIKDLNLIKVMKLAHEECECRPLTLNLFQGLESAVHWSGGYTMLMGLSLWMGRDSCLLTPRRYDFAHALGTGQAVGWCSVPIAVKFAIIGVEECS